MAMSVPGPGSLVSTASLLPRVRRKMPRGGAHRVDLPGEVLGGGADPAVREIHARQSHKLTLWLGF
jgi:hypothetical protein